MNWTGKYIIERDGLCRWRESMCIVDPGLAEMCREVPITLSIVELCAEKGVRIGVA